LFSANCERGAKGAEQLLQMLLVLLREEEKVKKETSFK
jgi:hypothetical protein